MNKTSNIEGRHAAHHGFIANQVASLQERLAARQAARQAMRTFRRELNTYSTPSQIDDLLAMISTQDDADSQVMRSVLVGNLHHRS